MAPEIAELPQVVMLEGDDKLDEELFLFSNVTGRKFLESKLFTYIVERN